MSPLNRIMLLVKRISILEVWRLSAYRFKIELQGLSDLTLFVEVFALGSAPKMRLCDRFANDGHSALNVCFS